MKKIFITIFIINLLLLVGQFAMTSIRATDGEKISSIEVQSQTYALDNLDINNQIYKLMATETVQQFALANNLIPAQTEYWKSPSVASILGSTHE